MAFLLAHLRVPLTWPQIFKRTFDEAFFKDNCLGLAAQLAYYFFFALFPALLFLIALASYFPLASLVDDIFRALGGFAPAEVLKIITDQIRKISEAGNGGLLTLGALTALWSSSSAMTAMIETLNAAYDIEEGRPWWKVRLTAIGLTVGVALFILVSFSLVMVGPTLAEKIADAMHLGPAFTWTWIIFQWPVVFALASTSIALIYYFAPDAEQDWVWLTPGSISATLMWLLASLGFKYYVANFGKYNETYGTIGAFMILLLWFYISGLVILLGAEMNAEIEHASPYGKDPGEKIPGQKRKIGPAAMRAWLARRRARGERKAPTAEEVKEAAATGVAEGAAIGRRATTVDKAPRRIPLDRQLPRARRFSDWVIGTAALAAQVWWAARAVRYRLRTPRRVRL